MLVYSDQSAAQEGFAFSAAPQGVGMGYGDLFIFGGVMTEGDFPGSAMVPLMGSLEDVFVAGAAYNHEFANHGPDWSFGGEVGLAGRFGNQSSADFWIGPSLRYNGFSIGSLTVSFGIVAGFSAVTSSSGIERVREVTDGGDAALTYYLGPEIGLTFDALPDKQFLFRSHHRSGGKNVSFLPTIGNMGDASNAYLFGVRQPF